MRTQISRLQFVYLMMWAILGVGIIILPPSISQFTIRDGWIVPLFFMVGTFISAGVCTLWVRTFPGQSLSDGLESAFGPWLGRVAGSWLLLWFLIATSMFFRQLILFITTTTLSKTPYYIITGVAILTVCYGAYHGIESLGRLAEFLTPLGFITGAVLWMLSLQNADFSQLRPVLADGWTPVLRGSVLASTSFSFEFIFALQFISTLRNGKTIGKDILIVGAVLSALGLVIEATVVSVLGAPVTYLSLPIMEVVRGIRIGQFVERLDTLFVMGVISTIIIEMTVLVYGFSTGIERIFRLPAHKNITWSTGAVIWAISILIFRNEPELREFILYVSPAYFTVSLVFMPLLAILVQTIRKRVSWF